MNDKLTVQLASTEAEILQAATVLLQLRPQYTLASILAQISKQQASGYQLAIAKLNDAVICAAGFVMTEKLAWGKHLYVDDLVTDEASRSLGAGQAVIDWLKDYAREQGCSELHLDSGVQRKDAHRFYAREGFDRTSYHFAVVDLES